LAVDRLLLNLQVACMRPMTRHHAWTLSMQEASQQTRWAYRFDRRLAHRNQPSNHGAIFQPLIRRPHRWDAQRSGSYFEISLATLHRQLAGRDVSDMMRSQRW